MVTTATSLLVRCPTEAADLRPYHELDADPTQFSVGIGTTSVAFAGRPAYIRIEAAVMPPASNDLRSIGGPFELLESENF